MTVSPSATVTPAGRFTFQVDPLVGVTETVAFSLPFLSFNVTYTVPLTVFPSTLPRCNLPPEIVVASTKTGKMVGVSTVDWRTG